MPLDQQQWKTSRNASYGRKQAKKAMEENKLYQPWKKQAIQAMEEKATEGSTHRNSQQKGRNCSNKVEREDI